jgi:hypothetical protein
MLAQPSLYGGLCSPLMQLAAANVGPALASSRQVSSVVTAAVSAEILMLTLGAEPSSFRPSFHRPTLESLREVVLHCIECFGVDRSTFGSDFPVGRLWTSFDAIFDGFKAIVRDFSEDPTGVAGGRPGSREIAVIPLRARNSHRPFETFVAY